MRAIYCVILSLALSSIATIASADDQLTNEQKREWLRDRIAASSREPNREEAAAARVARLTDNQLDPLFEYYRSGKADADQQKAESLDRKHDNDRVLRAAAARAFLQQRAAANATRPGYAPVITTLPSGASLAAGAVISPDGRYVRINAMPFFSNVQGFHTFNMANGQTQYYPLPQDPYGYGTLPNSPLLPQGVNQIPQPALQGVIPRPALEGYIPRPALQPRP
jgi:hypothetical protein